MSSHYPCPLTSILTMKEKEEKKEELQLFFKELNNGG